MLRTGIVVLVSLAVWGASPARSADGLPPELQLVPTDAAVFVHFDVATIWKSKIGESVRKMPRPVGVKSTNAVAMEEKMAMKAKPDGKPAPVATPATNLAAPADGKFYEETLTKVRDAIGLTPDDVKSVTFYFPKVKGPGDEASGVFIITLSKAYDRAKLVSGLATFDKDLAKPTEPEPGVYEFGFDPRKVKEDQEVGRRPSNGILRLVLTDPTRIVITGPRYKGVPKPATGTGPITPALQEAASGKTITLALNFAQFPEEIKGEELPPEVRPFKPLIHSELAMGTAMLRDGMFDVFVRVRAEDARKAGEAEKSLGALLTLGRMLLPQGIKELEKQKDGPEAVFVPALKNLLDGLNGARTKLEGNEATLALKVPADVPVGNLIAMIGLPASSGSAAARGQSANNLKQLGLAMHNYHDTHGRLPAAAICDKKGKPLLSWRVAILPYVEQNALYTQFKLDEAWDSEHNKKLLDSYPKVYALPGSDDALKKTTHYRVFTGKQCGFQQLQSSRLQDMTDGTSNTIMIVTAADAVPWTKPDDLVFDPKAEIKKLLDFTSQNGTTQFAFFDGSVRTITEKIKEESLKALITMNGGEVVNPNDN